MTADISSKYIRNKTGLYLPEGKWILTKDGKEYSAGWHEIFANIDEFVAFVKHGADVLNCF